MVLAGLLLLEFLPSCEGLEAANDARFNRVFTKVLLV